MTLVYLEHKEKLDLLELKEPPVMMGSPEAVEKLESAAHLESKVQKV